MSMNVNPEATAPVHDEDGEKDPRDWDFNDVVVWLQSGGFDKGICDKFIENDVDGDVLHSLDDAVLENKFRIGSYGKRYKIMNAISKLFPDMRHHPPDAPMHRRIPDPPPLAPDVILRDETVAALYEKLNRYKFIEVRGTPASGKSTLSLLLCAYIKRLEPTTRVVLLDTWAPQVTQGRWSTYLRLTKNMVAGDGSVLVFDEAQSTYWDSGLWNSLFKPIIAKECENRAIVFASYGSATSAPGIAGTNMIIPLRNKVTLRPIDHHDQTKPIGLFLTHTEFLDFVRTRYPSNRCKFDTTFFEWTFNVTAGHVGAITDLLRMISAQTSYRDLKNSTDLYTANYHYENVDLTALLDELDQNSVIFRRGLPTDRQIQQHDVATVLGMVCYSNVVTIAPTEQFSTNALTMCHRNGWLHADVLDNNLDVINYIFPSPLHRWFIERKLYSFNPTSPEQTTLLQFSTDVIRRFSPLNLRKKRIGPGFVQRPPEAQYQDEFYRCCHELSKGSTVSFPEFGTQEGQVDFYIPGKRWAIELLHEGDGLKEHVGCFSNAGKYKRTLAMEDYIVLDFRVKRVVTQHPNFKNLYHVVFSEDFHHVQILDSTLEVVDSWTYA